MLTHYRYEATLAPHYAEARPTTLTDGQELHKLQLGSCTYELRLAAAKFDKGAAAAAATRPGAARTPALVKNLTNLTAAKI